MFLVIVSIHRTEAQERAEVVDSKEYNLDNINDDDITIYVIRLWNGDTFTGTIKEIFQDQDGKGIKVRTEIGIADIFAYQIQHIRTQHSYNRNRHRLGLMPTADPIGDSHHVGQYELVMLFGGVGVADILSIQGGRTLIPGIPPAEQFSLVNIKATLYSDKSADIEQGISAAVGSVFGWLNTPNSIQVIYAVGTVDVNTTRVNGVIFAKVGGKDVLPVRVGTFTETLLTYATGSVGLGLGFDTKFTARNDTRVFAELWSGNVSNTNSTALLLGTRLGNETINSDFGLMLLPGQGAFIPYVSFFWTPF
jgi:hypothetical protein